MGIRDRNNAKDITLMFIVQAAIFIVLGVFLHLMTMEGASGYIPMSTLDPMVSMLVYGFAGLACLLFVNVGLYAIFMMSSKKYRIAAAASDEVISEALDIGVARIPILILNSLAEEMLFRYGLISFIAGLVLMIGGHYPERAILVGAVISSVIFAIVHSQYADVKQLLQVLVAGFVLSGVYVMCGNIFVVWTIHFLVNAAALAFEPLVQSKTRAKFPDDYREIAEMRAKAFEEEADSDEECADASKTGLGEDVGDGDSSGEGVELGGDSETIGDTA